jgi:pyrrolysine biosynthesis protein PylC
VKKVVVIGGKLQGTEACYLARKAGYVSALIDKRANAPASGVADETLVCDVCCDPSDEGGALATLLRSADLVLPALEDADALKAIARLAKRYDLPLAFDADAYKVTSSKSLSDALIHRLGVPSPGRAGNGAGNGASIQGGVDSPRADRGEAEMNSDGWIVKPSRGSGSAGVRRFATLGEARVYAASRADGDANRAGMASRADGDAGSVSMTGHADAEDFIIQRYLEGPSYSVEVVGRPGNYRSYEVTEIHVDDVWDCKLVTAPCALDPAVEASFRDASVRLAESLGLRGIMDAEAILHDGEMKMLEIDARIPSQTPAVVLASTGVNLLTELMELTEGNFGDGGRRLTRERRFVAYENIIATRDGVFSRGEHIMGKAGPLTLREGFFGADESLTDYREGCADFRGIFINSADTEKTLAEKRAKLYENIRGLMVGG